METADGLRPRFDPEVLARMIRETAGRSYWNEWRSVGCPTLIVTGGDGCVQTGELARMAATNERAAFVSIPAAGHDLHLDAPEAWTRALKEFLQSR